jgi:DNA-binding response OmpR family regulator
VSNQRTVLLVDDDLEIVEATGIRLRAAGYHTLVAHDGQEGIASAVRCRPDAILLDVRMPLLDGFGALAELRRHEDTKQIPIIVLSASVSDQRAALDAGARFFLRKPYQGAALVRAVDSVIMRDVADETTQTISHSE